MNLSALERMAQDGDMSADALRYLLSCKGECEWLDLKEELYIDNEKELCSFARDVLDLAACPISEQRRVIDQRG
jgi:hypothetical protein